MIPVVLMSLAGMLGAGANLWSIFTASRDPAVVLALEPCQTSTESGQEGRTSQVVHVEQHQDDSSIKTEYSIRVNFCGRYQVGETVKLRERLRGVEIFPETLLAWLDLIFMDIIWPFFAGIAFILMMFSLGSEKGRNYLRSRDWSYF